MLYPKKTKNPNPSPIGNRFGFFLFGGRGWIRTTEAESSRFTVCPHWPLGNTPIFDCFVCPLPDDLFILAWKREFVNCFLRFLQRFPEKNRKESAFADAAPENERALHRGHSVQENKKACAALGRRTGRKVTGAFCGFRSPQGHGAPEKKGGTGRSC